MAVQQNRVHWGDKWYVHMKYLFHNVHMYILFFAVNRHHHWGNKFTFMVFR